MAINLVWEVVSLATTETQQLKAKIAALTNKAYLHAGRADGK